MKLLRYGPEGQEKPGLLDAGGRVRDLSARFDDLDSSALAGGVLDGLRDLDPDTLPVVESPGRIGACVGDVGKIVAIGLNYVEHAREGGREIPTEPLLFMKATSSISGPNDPIVLPRGSEKTDWEVELAIVIGKTARNIDEADAPAHIAGYALFNDVSERDHQLNRGGQWTKGKCHDSFGPLGPWLVTADEIEDVHALGIWLEVDGNRYQDGNTSDMIFGVDHCVAYISRFMTLNPGDVIITGTPAGVGNGMRPERKFLREGQTVTLGADGLGEQSHPVVRERV